MTTLPYDLDLVAQTADPDAPTASLAPAPSSSRAPGSKPSGGRPGASADGGGGSDSEDDDAAPDYRLLGKLLGQQHGKGSASDAPGAIARHHAAPPSIADSDAKSKFGPGQGIIPKRGEKDFEPTGFRGQRNALEESRAAMFAAVGSERHPSKSLSVATWDPILQRAIVHSSKGILFQTMGLTNRLAQADDPPAKIDANGVRWPRIVSRIELTPEETLFLLERGVLDCRLRLPRRTPDAEAQRAGEYRFEEADERLDVQQAFALLLGADGCTKEVYGVYAYLRRLGYVVHRAQHVDEIRARAAEKARADRLNAAGSVQGEDEEGEKADADAARPEGIIAEPDRPLRLVTLLDILLYVPRRLAQLGGDAIRWAGSYARAALAWLANVVGRVLGGLTSTVTPSLFRRSTGLGPGTAAPGRGLLGIGGTTFADFDSAFSKLQIVPSGHDLPVRHGPGAKEQTRVAGSLSRQPTPDPFGIFFYAWRPATQFRKTYPPPPEYRIAICDARRQRTVPSAAQFASLFGAVPMPGEEALDEEDAARAAEQIKRNNASYGRSQSTKTRNGPPRRTGPGAAGRGTASSQVAGAHGGIVGYFVRALQRLRFVLELLSVRLFAHLPPGCLASPLPRPAFSNLGRGPGFGGGGGGINPFPPLKSGRRNVVVAVVDQGTTSLMRFGEAEFARWRLAGSPVSAGPTQPTRRA